MQRSIGITRNIQTIEMKLSLSLLILVLVMVIIDHVHAEPFDISRVWFQHTNQIVHVYDQLSRSGTNRTEQVDNKAIQVEQCRSSMRQLVQDAKQGQYYANKMIDSIGRPTSGILEGRLTYLGQYDECIATKGENFVGKYCIAHIQLPRNVSQTLAKISGISSSLYQNLPVKLGVCLPSTCSTEDVNTIAQQFSQMFEPALSVRVVECMENDSNQSQTLHYVSFGIFCGICSVLCLFVLVATIFEYFSRHFHCSQSQLILNSKHLEPKTDYQTETLSIKRQLLLAFSVRENLKKIFTVSTTSSDSIGVFHGIKFIAMIWIIFSHSISFSSQWMNFNNPLDIRKTSHNLFSQVIVNGTFSVDCFFFISGYLVTHILLKHLQQTNDKLNLSLFYLKRYLRMTPTMMVTIGFGATLLRYFGSGPEWTNSTAMFDSWCRSNWWVNSLYIHNFVHIDNMCLSHSWYSAVDTQFYMISPFLVMLLSRRPGLGVGLCVFLLTSSVGITWVLTILNNYPAVPYFNDIIPLDIINSYYQNIYIKPYCRIGPYVVGMLLAFSMLHIGKNIKLSKSLLVSGWMFTIVATLGVIVAMLPANKGNIPGVQVAAAYSATSRIIWSLGLSWVTFVSLHNYGGLVSSFLSLKVWIPFSRLTYCAYLVHPIIIAIFYGSRHQTFDFSFYLIFYFSLSNICITYMVSLLVALFVEYPIVSIGQILMKRT